MSENYGFDFNNDGKVSFTESYMTYHIERNTARSHSLSSSFGRSSSGSGSYYVSSTASSANIAKSADISSDPVKKEEMSSSPIKTVKRKPEYKMSDTDLILLVMTGTLLAIIVGGIIALPIILAL